MNSFVHPSYGYVRFIRVYVCVRASARAHSQTDSRTNLTAPLEHHQGTRDSRYVASTHKATRRTRDVTRVASLLFLYFLGYTLLSSMDDFATYRVFLYFLSIT